MNEHRNLHDQLEAVYGTMPESFHRRVQETLHTLSNAPIRQHRLRWGAVLIAVLLLATAIGVAATLSRTLGWMTHTAAHNWVLEEADDMLHTNAASLQHDTCTITLKEWLCDGERMYICVSVVDSELKSSESDDAWRRYAQLYSLGAITLSEGNASGGMTWEYQQGDEKGEILYLIEQGLEGTPDAFDVRIPVYFPEGAWDISFRVKQADQGRTRHFASSPLMQLESYTAQITRLRATALRTYGELTLTFDTSLPMEEWQRIVNGYMDGLGVPEGRMDTVAGEGEEILLPHTASWSEDGLMCVIQLDGNPRETYPDRMVYAPRWALDDEEETNEAPLLMDGAITMEICERSDEQ